MIYFIHTFELTAFCETTRKYVSDEFKISTGIKVADYDDTHNRKIKLIVNPLKVLGSNDLEPEELIGKDISKLFDKLEKKVDEYFDSAFKLSDFTLTRCDFTVNIDVGSQTRVSAYIKVLHNIGKVTGFSPKYKEKDYETRIDKDSSFDLVHSDGREFTAYNKLNQSKNTKAQGILRAEVRLKKPKAIFKYTNKSDTIEQIKDLSKQCEKIFMKTFCRIVPPGDHYIMKEAIKRIEDSVSKTRQREKMIRLLELTRNDSLNHALKKLKEKNYDRITAKFVEINMSPVTIRKKYGVKHLDSLYSYLGMITN